MQDSRMSNARGVTLAGEDVQPRSQHFVEPEKWEWGRTLPSSKRKQRRRRRHRHRRKTTPKADSMRSVAADVDDARDSFTERWPVDGVARPCTGAMGDKGTDGEAKRCMGPRSAAAAVRAESQPLKIVEPACRAASPTRGATQAPSPYWVTTWMRQTEDDAPMQQTGAENAEATSVEGRPSSPKLATIVHMRLLPE